MVTTLQYFVSTIRLNFRIHKQEEESSSSSNNMFTASAGNSTLEVGGEFVFLQTLIDCLLRMKPNKQDINELICELEKKYENNTTMLNCLHNFHDTYSRDKTIYWYSKESFFYETINTALRQQDIHTMFLWRSFLFDMYHQLRELQSEQKIKVYRGQNVSKRELETLKKRIGKLISVNSFLSTSIDRTMAAFFADSGAKSDDLAPVLFEIEADPLMVDTKPFADISKHSQHPDEQEILFMFGSIFRVVKIHQEIEPVWIIEMKLCDDDDEDVQEVLEYMQKQNGKGETNLQTLAKLMWQMGHHDLAKKYYVHFLKDLQSDDALQLSVYEDIAAIESQKGDYNGSMKWKQKALEFERLNTAFHSNNSRVPTIHSSARWARKAITVAGGHGLGKGLNQLYLPEGLIVDDDRTVYIADWWNNRVMACKQNEIEGCIVVGENRDELEELFRPSDLIIDKEQDCFIISDNGKRRVVRCSRENTVTSVETILDNILCWGLTIDDEGSLYVTDIEKHAVRRYRRGENMTTGTIVAGGNKRGKLNNQFNTPLYVFVDSEHAIYVSDHENHRVMKWVEGATEGIRVAGGQSAGQDLAHLWYPNGIIVDKEGTIYIADSQNHRVMRWHQGEPQGELVAGGHGQGENDDQLNEPKSLSFDNNGNMYVTDKNNHRVQLFSIH
ncbi:unnamed protein product [Adineta steineri]|uniref:ADP ribosyltransferase domain-containing protein n=1 Tax=Adineta steineri TaxID=433720 RepID=A0A815GTG0_9BILA|nr:unnamed protein product [Adineta steineri]CAF3868938.1 unnamed protein product [Adineta steineri]